MTLWLADAALIFFFVGPDALRHVHAQIVVFCLITTNAGLLALLIMLVQLLVVLKVKGRPARLFFSRAWPVWRGLVIGAHAVVFGGFWPAPIPGVASGLRLRLQVWLLIFDWTLARHSNIFFF